jgi:hypothetical protein
MRFPVNKKLWLLPAIVLLPISLFALRSKPNLPPVIIWAWERPGEA